MATVGYTTTGANDSQLASFTLFNPDGLQVVLSETGTFTKITAAAKMNASTGDTTGHVYQDSAGTRASLIATTVTSSVFSNTSYALIDMPFVSPPTLNAATYWLQVDGNTDGNPGHNINNAYDTGGGTNTGYHLSDLGAPQYNTNQYTLYATYNPSVTAGGWNIALV